MIIKVNKNEVRAEAVDHMTIWRLNDGEGRSAPGARSGLVAYGKPSNGGEPNLRGSHDVPEYFYVVSGSGFLKDDHEVLELGPGDGFVVLPGTGHVIWTHDDEPLVAFFVVLSPPAHDVEHGAHDHH